MTTAQTIYAFATAHWLGISGAVLGTLMVAATIANVFRDPDSNPDTPPPKWVQIVDALALLAQKNRVGVIGRFSIPGVKSRRRGARGKVPTPPATPPAATVLVLVALSSLAGCASWGEITRVSAIALERSFIEASMAARNNNVRMQEGFRERAAKVTTPADMQKLVEERTAYEAKYAKVVDGLNKTWATISAITAGLPLASQLADKTKRAEVSLLITNGLSFLLQVKDMLSAFGVQIGGVAL
jgi:hypothetical protein